MKMKRQNSNRLNYFVSKIKRLIVLRANIKRERVQTLKNNHNFWKTVSLKVYKLGEYFR